MRTFLKTVKFSYPFIFIALFTLYSNSLEAQIFDKIIKKSTKAAENAVIKKTEQKVYEETSKTMDTIFEGNSKKKQENEEEKNTVDENENNEKGVLIRGGDGNKDDTAPDGDVTGTSEDNTSPVEDNTTQKLKPWSKYNFVPGDQVIFQDDLTGEESGEFPSRWDLTKGNAENASLGDESIINMDNKSIVTPLMETSNYLPDVFTIEFDAYYNEVMKANYYQEYNLRFWEGSGSHSEDGNVYDPIKIFRHEIRFRIIKNGHVKNLGGEDAALDDKAPGWRHITIAFNKRSLKIFIDQYRVLNIPNMGFKPKMFSIGGESSQSKDDIIAIKNIRIAEGGKKLYDRVLADGKFVTTGILFDVNKATIKPESMGVINEVAKMMKEHPELNFSIEGHTDSDGSEANNQKLSEQRAASVKEMLISLSIDASRMETKGFGESVPVSNNTSPEGKANNRRVEFIKI